MTAATPVVQAGAPRSRRIESLRAVAALGVVISHVYGTSVAYGPATESTFLHRVLFGGGFGVLLFFALSGYLLFKPFALHRWGGGSAIDLGRYARNRALRILPLYYVLIVILLIAYRAPPSFWVRFGLFAQSLFNDTVFRIDPPTWSLAVELQYYILLPFIAGGIAVLSRGRLAVATLVLLILGAISLALRLVTVYLPAGASPAWRYAFPTNFVFFVPGMLLPLIQLRLAGAAEPRWLRSWLGNATLWWLAALAVFALVAYRYQLEALLVIATFLVVGACVLPLRGGRELAVLDWRPLALLGVASYSLYLWHDPILAALARLHLAPSGFVPLILVALPACIVVAVISYAALEAPWLRLRSHWANTVPLPARPALEEEGAAPDACGRTRGDLDRVQRKEPSHVD
ncbi:MAG: acyltransferase family protein [Candidatus Dormibacteria bacterium]